MTYKTINIGSTPNDGTGDPLRDAMDKSNFNFNSLQSDIALKESLILVFSL